MYRFVERLFARPRTIPLKFIGKKIRNGYLSLNWIRRFIALWEEAGFSVERATGLDILEVIEGGVLHDELQFDILERRVWDPAVSYKDKVEYCRRMDEIVKELPEPGDRHDRKESCARMLFDSLESNVLHTRVPGDVKLECYTLLNRLIGLLPYSEMRERKLTVCLREAFLRLYMEGKLGFGDTQRLQRMLVDIGQTLPPRPTVRRGA